MLTIYLYSFASVLLIGLISFIGIFTLSLRDETLKKYVFILVALAVGALLGDAFIHLIPEAFESFENPTYVSVGIIFGALIFFVLEKALHWHHHARGEEGEEKIHVKGYMILVSDGVHNFIDGLIIGASYLVSIEVGIATTLAVILHEIPQEIGDFGVLIHYGYSKIKALWLNFASALTSVLGVILALSLGSAGGNLSKWLLPVAAGGFIYIAMTDLVPELQKTKYVKHSVAQFVAILIGVGSMFLLLFME